MSNGLLPYRLVEALTAKKGLNSSTVLTKRMLAANKNKRFL